MVWVALTIAAAFLQNLRSMLQKRLTGRLSVNGAAYARFCYALPFAWLYLAILGASTGLPAPNAGFWAYCLVGSVGQMFATACLLAAFTLRSFAVSTALSKTEAVQTAIIGLLVLGDRISPLASLGIGISFVGVLLLMSGMSLRDALQGPRGLVLGLLAGAGLAVASVAFRGAALALADGDAAARAGVTLAAALTVQTVLMGGYLAAVQPGELRRVAKAARAGIWVGVCGASASVCWFTAMTLQASALVRALGQIELLFALLASGWVFRERIRGRELAGIGALIGGIYLLL
jgi:drug/metabolite transporter (DMT)-like permease